MAKTTKSFPEMIDSLKEKFWSEELWMDVGVVALKVLAIIILAAIVVKIGKIVIRKVFTLRMKTPIRYTERRQNTLLKLLENVIAYVVYFAAILAILSAFSINVAGLIAGAGVLGLAIGFGAQNLVRDIITGFFIIFEDQFSVGDYVRIGSAEGTVEEIGLRTTKLKGLNGELHIFPNGTIVEVVNFSINNSVAIVDVSVAYEADIMKSEALINEFLETLPDKYDQFIKVPQLLGVQNLAASEIIMRITAETKPSQHWAAARIIRRDLKLFMDEHGIEIPYPKMVMYQKKEGVSVDAGQGDPVKRQSAEGVQKEKDNGQKL
ncbi:mechanosensitive ion channel family protein [Paenisporosarcina cavernae]|uniref:Mechanosensitive ion channel family protein n=1 Tax=Paenisporosarcina cavernae TaxID=2320858 RepID=A0A385YRL5_9BACL|nr:mechanosensitive ion channel family protein [Paenisporosarcina cavernae]AYC28388.1 mechanosensitive ion channel family protein [Paenisporosarcina cavernae]